jgi:replicative DNA helicase
MADRFRDDDQSRRPSAMRVPPHDLTAEESLLGAMMLEPEAIAVATSILAADDFYKPAHSHIFDAVHTLYASGQPADPVTVSDELRRGGLLDAVGGHGALAQIMASTPVTTNAARYARIIEDHALLRRLIGVAGEISELGFSLPDDVPKALDRAESLVYDINQRRVTDSTSPISDLLSANLDRLEELFERDSTITGIPTGYIDLDELLSGLQKSALVIVGGRPSMGKCVAWDTPIVDPATGALLTAAEVYRRGTDGHPVEVLALGLDHELACTQPSAFVDDGRKPVFRVRTRLGREVRTTLSHPFLTPSGWQPLGALRAGDLVAVPAALPVFGAEGVPDAEIASMVDACTTRDQPRARRVERRIPDAVFRLPRPQLALFLSRLLGVGGSVWLPVGDVARGRVVFSTTSARLAREVQHLLLRFGICATVRDGVVAANDTPWEHEVEIAAPADIAALVDEIGVAGSEAALRSLVEHARESEPEVALASAGAPQRSPLRWAEVRREVEGRGAGGAGGAVRWDEIVAIEADGDDQVYDLTVPVLHNFVAADVFVHNTSFALGMAAHAAIHANHPVLLFSLEMGSLELSQRLLCAEARIDSTRVRNGRLTQEDWSKISQTMGRLSTAPIWIDDNPNTNIMEIRSKARRLRSQVGSLGMIVVDYLQLMTGRTSAENRQVEVAEISRGLKILARELECPVVALSQLSRNLEMRADKRPMLSDLRESGSLEQDSDVVMFIYRDEVYHQDSPDRGQAEIIVAKHRNGPTGVTRLAFLEHYTRFANMSRNV